MFSRLRQASNNGESQNTSGGGGGGYGNNTSSYNSNSNSNSNGGNQTSSYNSGTNNTSGYNSNTNANSNNNNSSGGYGNQSSNNNTSSYNTPSSNNNSGSYNSSNNYSSNDTYDTYNSTTSHSRTNSGSNNDSKANNNSNNKNSSSGYQSGYSNDHGRKEPSETGQSTASSVFSSSNAGAQSNVSAATSVSTGYGSNNHKGSPKKPSYQQLGSKMDTIKDEGTDTYGSSNVNNNEPSTASARRDTLYEDANEHVGGNNSNNRNQQQQNNESVNKTSANIQSWQQTSAHISSTTTNKGSNTGNSGRDSNSNSGGNGTKMTYSSSNNGKTNNDSHQSNARENSNANNNNSSYGKSTSNNNQSHGSSGNNQSYGSGGNNQSSHGSSGNHDSHAHGNKQSNNKSSRNLSSSGRSNSGKSASGRSNSGKGRSSPRQSEQQQHVGSKGTTTYNSNGTAQHLDTHTRTASNTGYGSSTTSNNSTGNKNSQDPIAQAGDFNDPNAENVFLSSESGSGSTRSPVVRFRIHTANLRVHSPVLTKKTEQESQKEHQLEEDSATLKHLFSLMYNRDSPILEPNDWQMVLRLARCAQKYDVVRAKERAIAYFTKNEQSGALSPFMTYAFAVQYNLPTLEAAAAERSVRYDVNKIPELIFNMMGFTAFQRLASFHAKRQEYYQDMLNALSIDPKEVADQCYQTGGVCVVTPLARLKQTLAWPRQVGRDASKRAPEPADVLRKIITEIGQIDCGTCAKALVEAGLAIQHTLETLPSYSQDDQS
ncbi:uncharacterized protein FA14DRAFT_182638 [Meira miltonrushii]|uniref:BTB domain-containing protein n=1 Tax=Meira miltonrushii TaxID=1280837 RepID=A0A316V5U5_9BASI|nr:uncharacterized protein FA14DRAFT_182638 [Meira miltonrushii]PWN31851.1 hypothetical protein FA14DRAFT_182638 [Meira miltonrushii]